MRQDVLDRLASNPWYADETITKAELKEILLKTDGWIMAQGRLHDIKSKHLGAGVYRVWLEERKYGTAKNPKEKK